MANNFLNLEKYFEKYKENHKENISINFSKRFYEFEFENKDLFRAAIEYNMYINGLSFYKEEKERNYQKTFSDKIFLRDKKCIVCKKGNNLEFEACHIVPVSEGGDFTESNGILLTRHFHKLYDNYLWSINPDTLIIEVLTNDEKIVGSIISYSGKKVNLIPDYFMKINLKSHWDKFQKK